MLGPVLVPVAAVAIGWYGVYQPQRARLRQAQDDVAEEQQQTAVQRDIAARAAVLDAYQKRLPATADTDWLIRQTAQIAGSAGIPLQTVKPAEPTAEQEKGYTRLTLTVETLATYHEVGHFVAALESASPFIRVDEVKVAEAADERPTEGGSANRRKMTLTVSTIHLP